MLVEGIPPLPTNTKMGKHKTQHFRSSTCAKGNEVESKTIHFTSSSSLAKGSAGNVMSSYLKELFSVMIINLNLKEKPQNSHKTGFFLLKSKYPYAFLEKDALQIMKQMKIDIPRAGFELSSSYAVQEHLAQELLKIFFEAKLLHCPADRTRKLPKSHTYMQPTPKGVAVLYRFVKTNGLKKGRQPDIIRSNFNSLELFVLERSIKSDKIYISESFVDLLFCKCMGPKPNVWSPSGSVDKIPENIIEELDRSSSEEETALFNFGKISFSDIQADESAPSDGPSSTGNGKFLFPHIRHRSKQKTEEVSPFSHKFFTNPESDAHVQYYVSNKGVRLFKNKKLPSGGVIDYCFSGKALWQWLMDCCDIILSQEATLLGQFFINVNLIEQVADFEDSVSPSKFKAARSALYRLTEKGKLKTQWNPPSGGKVSSFKTYKKLAPLITLDPYRLERSSFKKTNRVHPRDKRHVPDRIQLRTVGAGAGSSVTLLDILNDAGMRYLFRSHLESQYCVENFDCYHLLQVFKRDMRVLRKKLALNAELLQNKEYLERVISGKEKMNRSVKCCTKQANDCLSNAYNIFGSYLVNGATYEVNIDSHLKSAITKVMSHPHSPVASTFQEAAVTKSKSSLLFDTGTQSSPSASVLYSPKSQGSDSDFAEYSSADNIMLSNVHSPKKAQQIDGLIVSVSELQLSSNTVSGNGNAANASGLNSRAKQSECLPDEEQSASLETPTLTQHHIAVFDSPNEKIFRGTLFVLNKIYPLFDKISRHLYKLMETDSFGKFIDSDIYKETLRSTKIFEFDDLRYI